MVGAMAYIQRNHLKYWEFSILLCYGYKDLECIMGVGNVGRGEKGGCWIIVLRISMKILMIYPPGSDHFSWEPCSYKLVEWGFP